MRTTPSEAETQRAIMEYLAVSHIFAFRLNTAAMKVEGRFFRAHSLGKGAADICALPRSLVIPANVMNEERGTRWVDGAPAVWWIEVKRPGGQQSIEQAAFQKHVEAEGQNYLLVDSIDQVVAWVKSLHL